MEKITLDKLCVGEWGRIEELLAEGGMRRRMIDLGMVRGTRIECVGVSPANDPCAYLLRGAVIAIRKKDARSVVLCKMEVPDGTY